MHWIAPAEKDPASATLDGMPQAGNDRQSVFWGYLEIVCVPLLMVFHRLCYDLTGILLSGGAVDHGPLLRTRLDEWIPFVPVFVLPYILTWGYGGFIVLYALLSRTYDHRLFRYFYLAFLLMTGVECLLWLAFPAQISIRAEAAELARSGLLGELTAYVYQRATPWNVIPSAHIAFAWLAWLFSAHFAKTGHRWLFLALFSLVVLSVLFIKNHYLADVAGGVLLGQLIYWLVFRPACRRGLLDGLPGFLVVGVSLAAATAATLGFMSLQG